jgi:hypothetical protein
VPPGWILASVLGAQLTIPRRPSSQRVLTVVIPALLAAAALASKIPTPMVTFPLESRYVVLDQIRRDEQGTDQEDGQVDPSLPEVQRSGR